MSPQEFANKIRTKYPTGKASDGRAYSEIPDDELAKKIIAKYPVYAQQVKFAEPAKPSIGQRVLDAGTAVSNFVGAKGISDQFATDIARARAPQDQKNLIDSMAPPMRSVLGSALQTGANFIPGAGVGASLAAKVGAGAATGYAIDVGSKLQTSTSLGQALKPGLATALGAALPVAGKLTGLSNTASAAKKTATNLEKANLRLTPVEQQNLAKQGKDVANFLAAKKVIGTPEQRAGKIEVLYDDMERNITRVVDSAKVTVPKKIIIDELKKIPEKYADNLSEYDGVVSKVERMINTLNNNRGDSISTTVINAMKRNEWKNAYSKNNTDVINEVSDEVGHIFKDILDKSVKGLQPLNKEYGMLIASRRALGKAATRNQAGVFTRGAGVIAGTAVGGALGGGVGAGAGAYLGDKAANTVATPLRSFLGAAAQTASNILKKNPMRGVVQPVRKATLQAIRSVVPPQTTTTETSPEAQTLPQQDTSSENPSMLEKGVNAVKDHYSADKIAARVEKASNDPLIGLGIASKGSVATEALRDALILRLEKGAPSLSKLMNATDQITEEAAIALKNLKDKPVPTMQDLNDALEILKMRGDDVSSIVDDFIKAAQESVEQLRDNLGRWK